MDILRVGALGGLLGLDGTAVGQFMVSRPLVAGVLAGWMLGVPALGGLIGGILEVYLLVSFPTGGARFPEGATATVVAVAAAAPFDGAGVVPLGVAVGLVWGQIGGASVTAQRHLNSRLVPESGDVAHDGSRVVVAHVAAILLDFVRGTLVTMSGVIVGRVALSWLTQHWPLSTGPSIGLVLVGGAVSAGVLLHDLGGFRKRRLWFVAGLALGIVGTRFL
ncbi:MAG: PTS sugar transporter subunit IIC [Gemmatimonadetes bacterium]|nr:PTS sugar transporter subunit IIC [Gemmatimonadota bacterium]MDA1104727.1 PTS sugar transporter subunit IIC [Gemmatimonadota bacterium]